ncbi:MAG: VWA domain-containing protein [Clostridia bacterium]|jgi:hypothetical protein|nr:VWA domain-containing protein [Clostridia bacterium]MBT7123100.1 VWA domain-containing protein [Clostridia bacterium]
MKRLITITIVLILACLLLASCAPSEPASDSDSSYSSSDLEAYESSDELADAPVADVGEAPAGDFADDSVESEGDWADEPAAEEAMEKESADTEGSGHDQSISGQLTAGEWNDNEEFGFFTELMQNNEWYGMKEYWGFDDFTRIAVTVLSGDTPVQNAQVEVRSSQGETLFQAITDNEGIAYLFPGLFSEAQLGSELTIHVTYNDARASAVFDDNQDIYFDFDNYVQPSNQVDIMFMIDTTGSMSDELEYLKTELINVIDKVQSANAGELDIRLSANFYRDKGDDYIVKPFPFQSDIGSVINQIERQSANGGGDYPEAVTAAMQSAIKEHDWNPDAKARLLFLVLDAPPHHTGATLRDLEAITEQAAAMGIKIIPIASSGVDKETEFLLRFLSVSTNGTYVFLTDHSGIGNSHIEPTIGDYDVEYLNDLLVRLINEQVN